MKQDKKSILICGNYGASNLGDEAILGGLVNLCRSAAKNAHITAMSANPFETSREFGVRSVWHFPAGFRSFLKFWFGGRALTTLRATWSADLILLGGGGLFSDERPRAVWIWFVQCCWFWLMRKKIFCIAQSVGPLNTVLGRWMTARVFKSAKRVTVRDEKSKELLEKLGVEHVEMLADPAYAIGYDHRGTAINRQKKVVLSLRNWKSGLDEEINLKLAKIVDWIEKEHGLKTVFIPFQKDGENDLERFNGIAKLVKNRNSLELADVADFQQAIEVIGRSEMVIGMRLHSIIFSVLARTPFLALSYSKKVKDFVDTLKLGGYCLDYGKLEISEIKKVISKVLDEKEEIIISLEKAKLLNTYKFFQHEAMVADLLKD